MPLRAGLQIGLATLGVAMLGVAPPADGLFLVVPLDGAATASTMNWATGGGAAIAGLPPLPGGLVVAGSRARLLPLALRHHALLLDARTTGCATPEGDQP